MGNRLWRSLDPFFSRVFGDDAPTDPGSGWAAGVIAVLAGFLAAGGVLCFRFPGVLTAPGLRSLYPLPVLRAAIGLLIGAAIVLGLVSARLRRRKVLGLTGVCLGVAALVLGGPAAALPRQIGPGPGLGFDWFLLNVLIMTLLYASLERAAPLRPEQPVFRKGWTTDGVHLLVSHVGVQVASAVIVLPGQWLRRSILGGAGPSHAGALPFLVQLAAIVVIADLCFYWIHRTFHAWPLLWRLHRIHHSNEQMDWLASERLHVVEIVIVRALVLTPLILIGFGQGPLLAYVTFASVQAVLVHANFRSKLAPRLGWVERILVTPRIHHLHHAADGPAVDKNFAIHLPVLDRLFGTLYAPPGVWPTRTGVDGRPVPEGYWAQQLSPFRSPHGTRSGDDFDEYRPDGVGVGLRVAALEPATGRRGTRADVKHRLEHDRRAAGHGRRGGLEHRTVR